MRWGFHYYIGLKLWSYSWFLCEILKFYGVCLEKVGLIILTLKEMFVFLRLVFIYNVVLTVWRNNFFWFSKFTYPFGHVNRWRG